MGKESSSNNPINFIGIALTYAIFFGILLFLKSKLYDIVVPIDGIAVEDWINFFFKLSTIILSISFVVSIARYILEQWYLKEKYDSQRLRWTLNFLLHIFLVIGAVIYSNMSYPIKEGSNMVILSYVILGLLPYYFATTLFSPSSIKYSAPLSVYIRRW